jgi:hypothetical protein
MGAGGAMMAGAVVGMEMGMMMDMDRNRGYGGYNNHRGGVVVVDNNHRGYDNRGYNNNHYGGYDNRGHTNVNVHKNVDVTRNNGHVDVHKSTHVDVNHSNRGHGGVNVHSNTNVHMGGGGGHHGRR